MHEQNLGCASIKNSMIMDALAAKSGKNNTLWGVDYIVMMDKAVKKEELKKTVEGMLLMRALGI